MSNELPKTRRSWREMQIEILIALHSGLTSPTRIMYRLNMSWKSLSLSLNQLVLLQLVNDVVIPGKRKHSKPYHKYTLTEKGLAVVNAAYVLKGLLDVPSVLGAFTSK